MKATGKIEIEQGLTLNNPTLQIVNVSYNWLNNKVSIEIHFNEENSNFKHSRSYEFEALKELTSIDILNLVSNHKVLKSFK